MRAKTGITIACASALSFVLCAGPGLWAQAPAPPAQPAEASQQDSSNDLYVGVGKTVLVDCAWPIARVALGSSDIAEVHATGRAEIMVNGKAAGETSLIIWDTRGGRQFYNVTVRAGTAAFNDELDAIRRELRTELPGQTVKINSENGAIFLRGNVKDLNASARAAKIAAVAVGKDKVVNLLTVDVPPSDPQILLKVRFASVDRNKAKTLGINLASLGLGNTIGGIATGTAPSVVAATATTPAAVSFSNTPNISVGSPIGALPIAASIQALETQGVVETLAEPNIIAANGKQASFLAGGEYPYPVAQASSVGVPTITIQFKEYGIRLNFIPTITPRGSVRLQVAPEVSSLDFTHAVEISDFEIPAITSRKMNTEVELSDGQSFVIAGLLDNEETETFNKIPFLGSIPILGKFFQSMTKNKTNTELIVLVTPEIVAPIQAGGPLPELKYPTKFLPPNTGIPMNNPDAKTAANTPAPAPPSIPVEKLVDSMKPETPLVIEGTGGGFGAASSSPNTTNNTAAPATQ